MASPDLQLVCWLDEARNTDVAELGGKNASLGEMIGRLGDTGIRVPEGFATTAEAYRRFVEAGDLAAVIGEQTRRLRAGAALSAVGRRSATPSSAPRSAPATPRRCSPTARS